MPAGAQGEVVLTSLSNLHPRVLGDVRPGTALPPPVLAGVPARRGAARLILLPAAHPRQQQQAVPAGQQPVPAAAGQQRSPQCHAIPCHHATPPTQA